MLLALVFLASMAVADDGDSFRVGGAHIRLWGVDAFEAGQTCADARGREWACGRAAAAAMAEMLAMGPVKCSSRGVDRYRRTVAVCSAGAIPDVAAAMVRRGLALDWPRYSGGAYAGAERDAKAAMAGAWRGTFVKPWEWRRGKRR